MRDWVTDLADWVRGLVRVGRARRVRDWRRVAIVIARAVGVLRLTMVVQWSVGDVGSWRLKFWAKLGIEAGSRQQLAPIACAYSHPVAVYPIPALGHCKSRGFPTR